jgi:hypothetical protein
MPLPDIGTDAIFSFPTADAMSCKAALKTGEFDVVCARAHDRPPQVYAVQGVRRFRMLK